MKFTETPMEGLLLIEPQRFADDRGTFMEAFNLRLFRNHGIQHDFVQDNESISKKNVIRGLHFQVAPNEQGKLVRVLQGRAMDVVLDLRKDSKTYGRSFSVELTASASNMLWIPPGFAHGFEALEEDTIFFYKVTNYYHKAAEAGIRFDDPEINIQWKTTQPIVSEKDRLLPTLREWSAM
jgi:dTDP-4-dehydrorhamnose 3,5-epimerase